MVWAEFLSITLNVLGIPTTSAKVLDCCAGDGSLAFALVPQFGTVGSNDMDSSKTRAQTHYDVLRPEFWQSIHNVYEYIITKPPADLVETILQQGLEHCSLIALLLSPEKMTQIQSLLAVKAPSITIQVGSQNSWLIWAPSLSYRNLFIDFNDQDINLRSRMPQDDFLHHIKDRISFFLSSARPSFPTAQNAAQFMQPHPFYSQSQFQSPAGYPVTFGYADDQYLGATNGYPVKREPGAYNDLTAKRAGDVGPAAGPAGSMGSAPSAASFVDFASLPLGAGYPPRHPGAAAYAPQMLPYYSRNPQQPPSPTQGWQFQQSPWTTHPGFSAAHMASTLGSAPGAPHVGAAYPGGPVAQFNPAAILMDMDKLTQNGAGASAASAAANNGNGAARSPNDPASAAAGAPAASPAMSYGLHKPTAFKAGGNIPPTSTSPGPTAAAVAAAIEDQQLMLSQAEMLYLKGVHAAKQGKALEVAIDKYRAMYSKKDVITKVCKMKYRSAQRKLRIAKHIQRFPEISTMTQRQAERYISEKLRKSRNADGRTSSPDAEED
jgi:hypothetical protein